MATIFMRLSLLLALLGWGLSMPCARAEPSAAAFITVIDLKGADRDAGTAIRRGGEELPPRLLMPLYEGDEVFLRAAGSRIVLETEAGVETDVTGAGVLYQVKGDAAAGGGFWSMLGAVAEAVGGGEGDIAPDNMMTRETDDVISVPMAIRGSNHVVGDERPVWISWRGGKAPYRVSVSSGGSVEVHEGIGVEEFSFPLPSTSAGRVKVAIEDAGGRKVNVLLKLRDKRPETPFGSSAGRPAAVLADAAWLTRADDGSWAFEAARLLSEKSDGSPAAALLLRKIGDGWKAGEAAGN
jgi:hypothetical protein